MAIYSIKDLEKLCGIKAHTIRIWESRYNILCPKRTLTNIRYYEDEDLKRLLNISLLNKNGIKISDIASMTEDKIAEKVAAITEVNFEFSTQLDALSLSMVEMDEFKFDRIINTNIAQIGFESTMLEIIYPFLDKLVALWLTGSLNVVQEIFISYLIRQKIIAAIDREPIAFSRNCKKFIIYLPEGENQELILLFLHYLLKSRGHHVICLGKDININDLKVAVKISRPDFICTFVTETFAKSSVQVYVDELSETFKEIQILLSGHQVMAQNVQSIDNIKVLHSLDATIKLIDKLGKSN